MRSVRTLRLLAAAVAVLGVIASLAGGGAPRAAARPFTYDQLKPIQRRIISPPLADALRPRPTDSAPRPRTLKALETVSSPPSSEARIGTNIKVNQDQLNDTDADTHGRGQAQNEPWISVDPTNPNRVIASYHDYRRGDASCGVSYSADGGRHWRDSTLPTQFVRGMAYGGKARYFFQAGGDPGVAWDSRGNAYYACGMFNRGPGSTPSPDLSTGLYVYRSTGTGGATWNFAGRPVVEQPDLQGEGLDEADRQLIAVDADPRSRFRDRIYVTWTRIGQDGTAYILASHSTDYGETFSKPVVVSLDSVMCTFQHGAPTPAGRCNENQGSQPVIGPDGALYVFYNNYNTPVSTKDNRFQVLASRSTDGGETFSPPVKVGDFYDFPDCTTYQGQNPDNGCVPEKGETKNSIFRAANYPQGEVDPSDPHHLVVSYGSYINRNSNEHTGCTPMGFDPPGQNRTTYGPLYAGVKNGGCNNDIVIATSTDGGSSFDGGRTDVRQMPTAATSRQKMTDQFFQGLSISPHGSLVIAYYDRQYGDDERTGYSDITLTIIRGSRAKNIRVTATSMPPPTQMSPPYFGDIIRVAATSTAAMPIWVDTRRNALFLCSGTARPGVPPRLCTGPPPGPQTLAKANDQDIATAQVPITN
ncbi:exo-alpha-sialidase [Actinomadura sp. LD22]|uniref:Exo-alpha-sialidase n=1 Tax=Actinomadura physcomitrii TaxID=2650748 RepID=A0A6I4MDR7_9ACTN|nr:sialidase family protein [Actinomadura physcomitrii]MWA02675.1 exo-alpha-sialidase [Actinomadura physcomitrii]